MISSQAGLAASSPEVDRLLFHTVCFTMLIMVGIQQLCCQSVILSKCVLISFISFPLAISLYSLSGLDNLAVGLPFKERRQCGAVREWHLFGGGQLKGGY